MKYRLYLNPSLQQLPSVISHFAEYGKSHPLYFKIVDPASPYSLRRLDKIVAYLPEGVVDEVLGSILEFSHANQTAFSDRPIPGGSLIKVEDGIGLAQRIPGQTGGEINAQRIKQALQERALIQIRRVLEKAKDPLWKDSQESRVVQTLLQPKESFWPELYRNPAVYKAWTRGMLNYFWEDADQVGADLSSNGTLLNPSALQRNFISALHIEGKVNIAQQISELSEEGFQNAFYMWTRLGSNQIEEIGLALGLLTVLAKEEPAGDYFKKNNIS